MSYWQGRSKRKPTGGRLKKSRKKRKYEMGSPPTETTIGPPLKKFDRKRSNIMKIRLKRIDEANITDPNTGVTKKVKILKLLENPANVEYTRRRIITKGAKIETKLGTARVTSRVNQIGIVNGILIEE
ncbi:MAG: 30S ribosomal protein S8e [Candidatus Helarchaeota archaeon]